MNKTLGFTLIEVLIALAIVSIALTAIIKSTSQNTQATRYLHEKTLATFVGTHIMNQARGRLLKLPIAPDKLEQETITLNETWVWQAYVTKTPNPRIAEIHVDVARKADQHNLVSLMSYVYNQNKK